MRNGFGMEYPYPLTLKSLTVLLQNWPMMIIPWVVQPSQDAIVANEGFFVGIPYPKNVSCHPGGDEPASWEGGQPSLIICPWP